MGRLDARTTQHILHKSHHGRIHLPSKLCRAPVPLPLHAQGALSNRVIAPEKDQSSQPA